MEFYSYHDGLSKWVEVGNSGVFRPEMLRPMGFDEDVTVIAWGMSLERPTMIKCAPTEPRARARAYARPADGVHSAGTPLLFSPSICHLRRYGMSNIRDLFGHKIDLNMTRAHPMVRWT